MKPNKVNEVYKTLRNEYCNSCDYQYSEDGTINTVHCELEDTENLPCVLLRIFDIIFNDEAKLEAEKYE